MSGDYSEPVTLCRECCGTPAFPYCPVHTPVTWAYYHMSEEERTMDQFRSAIEEQTCLVFSVFDGAEPK